MDVFLSIGTPTEAWFNNLFEDTLETDGIAQFDSACRLIQDKTYEIPIRSIQNRKNENISFEYDLHEFHLFEGFALMYWDNLSGRITEYHPGCLMLCMCLSRMHAEWLRDVLTAARKERNPEMFMWRSNHELNVVEEKNVVNRFLGWAIFSAMERFKDEG